MRILLETGTPMRQFTPLLDFRVISPTQNALALGMVTDLELLRLKTLARWYGRGLPPEVTWEDLLQETLTRILVGRRPVPEGVPIVAFIAGVMRSVRSEHWQRREDRDLRAAACGTEIHGPGARNRARGRGAEPG